MRTSILALIVFSAAGAQAAPVDILSANRTATGGISDDVHATLSAEFAYSGQGLTGTITSRTDLKSGAYVDALVTAAASFSNGFDGKHAWSKDPSGSITLQDGGDQRQLAVNEAYRRANLWWRSDFGGATIVDDGKKSEGASVFDVLTVTPREGKKFDAWFDAGTHFLVRVVEIQGPQTITSTLSDFRREGGITLAHHQLVDNGDAKYDQTLDLKSATFGPAVAIATYSAPNTQLADFGIAGPSGETTFPFHLANNHIYADVRVNGRGPYQFIFDTGGENFVTPSVAAELGLASQGHLQGGGAGSGHVDIQLTKIAKLEIGDAMLKDQVLPVFDTKALEKVEGMSMQGMVGFETFRRFVTRIDYGASTITLIMPEKFDAKNAGTAIPFNFNGNTIEVSASLDGVTGNFTVDTGSRSSITLNAPFVAANHLDTGRSIESVNGWGIGGASRGIVMRARTLNIGGLIVERPVTELSTDKGGAFTDAAIAGNIGAGILKRYVVTLDYAHQTLYLKPVTASVADLDTFDRAGMWMNVADKGFEIVDVTKHSPAEEAGLKAGDTIVAVDGASTSTLKLYELRVRLRTEAPGTRVTFRIVRAGERKDVTVTLRDLI